MPISRESDIKTKLKKQLTEAGHYARRFEDQYSVGILDMEVALKGDDVLYKVEVKIVTGNQKFGMTPRQYVEAVKYLRLENKAVIPVLAGWREEDKRWFLAAPTEKIYPKQCLSWSGSGGFDHLLKQWRLVCDEYYR